MMSDNDDVHAADWWKDAKNAKKEEGATDGSDEWMRKCFRVTGIEGTEHLILKEKGGVKKERLLKQYRRLVVEGLWGAR